MSISCCLSHQNPATYLFRAVLACKRCLICADFSPDSDRPLFHWKKRYYGLYFSNGFEVKNRQTRSFWLHEMLIDGLEWCGLLADYCDVFISCLDSNSDGTHSGSIGEQVMECYISPNLMKTQTHLHPVWPEGE